MAVSLQARERLATSCNPGKSGSGLLDADNALSKLKLM
jgi:hypothetical protein